MTEDEIEIFQPKKQEAKVEKPKAPNYFFDFLKDISQKKEYIYNDETKKSYVPYMVNRYLSMDQGTVLYAQEMNLRPGLPPELHYEYLMAAIRPMYRHFKYKKGSSEHEDVQMLSDYYECSLRTAREYFKLHTLEDIRNIANKMNVGGVDAKARRKKTKS